MRRLPFLLLALGVGDYAWAQDAFPAPSLSEPPPTETVTPSAPPVATENDEALATEAGAEVVPPAPSEVPPAPSEGAPTVVDGSSTNAGAMAAQPMPMATPEFPSGPAWIDNSYAELGAAVRAFRERLAEHGDVEPAAPKEPEGVSATSVNGALAGLAAMVAAQQTPPQAAVEPVASNAPVEEKKKFEQKTLFGTTRRSGRFGAHIGFTGLASQYDGNDSAAWGVEGGFVIGSAFLLGGGIYATDMVSVGDTLATLAYGGFQPGLILWTKSVIHPRLDMLLGGGVAFDAVTGAFLGEAAVVVPRMGLELNISRALRASGNLGWRFVGSSSPETQDFSSFEAGFSIRLGWM